MATRLNSLALYLDGTPLIRVSPIGSYGSITFYIGDEDDYSARDVGFITSVRYRERLERAAAEFNRIMREPVTQAEAAE